jgi:hypothetical protein
MIWWLLMQLAAESKEHRKQPHNGSCFWKMRGKGLPPMETVEALCGWFQV